MLLKPGFGAFCLSLVPSGPKCVSARSERVNKQTNKYGGECPSKKKKTNLQNSQLIYSKNCRYVGLLCSLFIKGQS